jgi:hypothetical protein
VHSVYQEPGTSAQLTRVPVTCQYGPVPLWQPVNKPRSVDLGQKEYEEWQSGARSAGYALAEVSAFLPLSHSSRAPVPGSGSGTGDTIGSSGRSCHAMQMTVQDVQMQDVVPHPDWLASASPPALQHWYGKSHTHPSIQHPCLSLCFPVSCHLVSPVSLCRLMSSLRRALAVTPEHTSHRQILSDC